MKSHRSALSPWENNGIVDARRNRVSELDVLGPQKRPGVGPRRAEVRDSTEDCVASGIPTDADAFLLTPDAELCARHCVSLAQVRAWRRRVCALSSPLARMARTVGTGFTCQREGLGSVRRTHSVCTAADLLQRAPLSTSSLEPSDRAKPLLGSTIVTTPAVDTPSSSSSSSSHYYGRTSVSTGLPTLDGALLGGLRRGWVTELMGVSGVGKSTLVASWCRRCIWGSGRDEGEGMDEAPLREPTNGCVWLRSGSAIDSAVWSIAYDEKNSRGASFLATSMSEKVGRLVHTASLTNLAALQRLLDRWQTGTTAAETGWKPSLHHVQLLVIDNLTDLVLRSFGVGDDDALQRHEALASVLQALKRLAEEQHVAVLIVTQQQQSSYRRGFISNEGENEDVDETDEESKGTGYSFAPPDIFGGRGRPSDTTRGGVRAARKRRRDLPAGQLGRLFFHNVNMRLRLRNISTDGDATDRRGWQLEIVKCPLCAPFSLSLRLEAPPRRSLQGGSPPVVPGPPLRVVEVVTPDGRAVVVPIPADVAAEEDDGLAVSCLDPIDFLEAPTFIYI